jgi:hypothetical protein
MEQNLIKIDPKEFGLDENQAQEIEQHFTPVISERENLAIIYNELVSKEMSKELILQAHDLRMKLVKVRTNTDKIHQAQKAFFLAGGRYVDAWKNKTKIVLELMEEKLSGIENYFINIEKEKLEKLKQERIKILSEYIDTPESYPVAQMSEEAFNNLIEGQKLIKKQRIEEAKKAEKERIEKELRDAKERERIRLENEQLRKENELKEQQLQKERDETARLLKEAHEKAHTESLKLALEQVEKDRIAQIERDKIQAENDRIQKELKDKKDAEIAEQNRLAEIERQKQIELEKALKAPDKTKLTAWIDNLILPELSLSSPQSFEIAQNIDAKFESFKKWAKEQIETI